MTEENSEYKEPESKSFRRHVKRHIQAPIHHFAAIAPPELIPLCKQELLDLGMADAEASEGGVEFTGKLASCYKANLQLRTGSRIYCRLPPFRAAATEELFHKVLKIPWELWLGAGIPLDIRAYVERSRIEHEGAVGDTVLQAIKRRFREQRILFAGSGRSAPEHPSEKPAADSSLPAQEQRVLVHLRENRCRISLDTSGAHLHQRGYRLVHAGAPLRETIAAGVLMKSGWKGDSPLIDGMSGAGTMAIEAALLARNFAPGLHRSFLFEMWPGYERKTWAYLRREAAEQALSRSPVPIIGVDSSEEALTIARRNGEAAGVAGDIQWEHTDFFAFDPGLYKLPPGMLALNPPYGKRLSGGGADLYKRVGAHIRMAFKGWRVAALAPSRSLAISLGLNSLRLWNITHGGIAIVVAMGKV
ncbi:MAG: class I SAM-dependent RNA methyltransferase [Syntrophobacteraceae bacterium]